MDALSHATYLRSVLKQNPKLMMNYLAGMQLCGLEFPRYRDFFCTTVLDEVLKLDIAEASALTSARIVNAGDLRPGPGFFKMCRKLIPFQNDDAFWRSQLPCEPEEMDVILSRKKNK